MHTFTYVKSFIYEFTKQDKYKPIKPKFVVIKNLFCLPLLQTNENLDVKFPLENSSLYFCKYIFDEI